MNNGSHSSLPAQPDDARALQAENSELRIRLREMEDTLQAIYGGDVDALLVNDDIFLLESAGVAGNRLRQDVLGQMQDAVFAFDNEDHLIFLNPAAEQRYGLVASEALGCTKDRLFTEISLGEDWNGQSTGSQGGSDAPSAQTHLSTTHVLANGESMYVESSRTNLVDAQGQPFGSLIVVRDVSQNHRDIVRRDAMMQLSEALRDLDDVAQVSFIAAEIVGRILNVKRAGFGRVDLKRETVSMARNWAAFGVQDLSGIERLRDYGSFIDDLIRNQSVRISDIREDPRTSSAQELLEHIHVRAMASVPVFENGELVAMLFVNDSEPRHWADDDIQFAREVAERTRSATERVRNAAALRDSELRLREVNEGLEASVLERSRELLSAQEALRQAQKMEAVGQLTGGIAHDFNNLLAGISVSLEVLQRRLQKGQYEDTERYLRMSLDGIKRAASLTQRLLAFARRQTLDPKSIDLNRLVSGMQELIHRSIGPNIVLEVVSAAGLWATRIDAPQLENALLNLCINARDAMAPLGGRLTIETANKWLDQRAAAERDLAPGQYVALSVSDTGVGIPKGVISRIFDPFFTTKPMGQGTGLGLSMVYGFVRQSGGQVRVYSEVGHGTTMCLYLPRHVGETEKSPALATQPVMQNGNGRRILVIEDEATIRFLIAEVLQEAGYVVITAEDGPSGLRILQTSERIDMLVTDVGLPGGLNGRQVADAARVSRPDLQVLFITGYAENAAVGNGLLEPGMQVMTKPFDIFALANKVKEMSGQAKPDEW